MFKIGSFEAEIAKSMADHLATNSEARKTDIVKTAQLVQSTKLSKAVDCLNQAAELFDGCGFNQTAELLTKLIEKMADHKEKHSEEEPEMFEFESLLKDEDGDEDLGDQVIEMRSIANDTSKKKV